MEMVITEAGEALLELLAGGCVIVMFAKLFEYVTSF